MDFIVRNAKIIDSSSRHHGKTLDVLIKNGKIQKIGKSIQTEGEKEVKAKGLHLSKGWIDLMVNYQDPGNEYKEDLHSGLNASASGGFTTVCVSPQTLPRRDSKSQVEYLINQTKDHLVKAYPYGTVSKNMKGKELAELADMHASGAIAFTEGKHSINNPNLLYRALLYAKSFDGLILNFPNTSEMSLGGVMNEGKVSTGLGLKGIPELAEVLMVNRDLHLLEYTDSRLHFSTLSSPDSLDLLKKAKKSALKISCDLASYHLLLNDEELDSFDSRFKTLPPLRSKESQKKLIKAVKDGLVDALSSDHLPEDIENKKKELDHAAFGIINAQTAFAAANTALSPHIEIEQIIALFTDGPTKILKLKSESIEEGEKVNLSLFCPEEEFVFSEKDILSKSTNSPLIDRKLKGKVVGVIRGKKAFFNP